MVKEKPLPEVYNKRKDLHGNEETRTSLVGKHIRFNSQTGDDEGVVREFNPETGKCRVQMYSGKMVNVSRKEFETLDYLVHFREQSARDALAAYADQMASDRQMAENGNGDGGDDDLSLLTGDPSPAKKAGTAPLAHGPSAASASDIEVAQQGAMVVAKSPSASRRGSKDAIEKAEHREAYNEEEVVVEVPLGPAGEAFLGGTKRRDPGLANTAQKYDDFRKYLKEVRTKRAQRKTGQSVLEDMATIASDPSEGKGAGGDAMDQDAIKQHAREAKQAALAEFGVSDDVSELSSSSLAISVWSYGTVNQRSALMQRARMFGTDPLAEPNRQLVPRIRYRTRRQPRVALRKRLEEEERQAQLAASAQGRLLSFEGYGPERHPTTTLPNLKVVPLEKPEQRFLTPLAAEAAVELAALEADAAAAEGGGGGGVVIDARGGAEKTIDLARVASPLKSSRQQQQQQRAQTPEQHRPSAGHQGLLSPPLAGMHFPGEDEERRVRIALLSTPSGTPARTPRFGHDYYEDHGGGGRRSGLSTARSAATSESSATSASGASRVSAGSSNTSGSGKGGSSSSGSSRGSSSGSDSEEGDRRGGHLETIDEDDDPSCFDYVFPVVITKAGDAACTCKWAPGSDVEVAWNKGDNSREVAMKFVMLHNLPGAVADCVAAFVAKTDRKDPSAAFARPLRSTVNPFVKQPHDDSDGKDNSYDNATAANNDEDADNGRHRDSGSVSGSSTSRSSSTASGSNSSSSAGANANHNGGSPKKPRKLTGAELDAQEEAEAAAIELAARMPQPQGGAPLRHRKRDNIWGALGPPGGPIDFHTHDPVPINALTHEPEPRPYGGGDTGLQSYDAASGTGGAPPSFQYTPQMAFMVLATLRKGIHDKDRVFAALQCLLTDVSSTPQGCTCLANHNAVTSLIDAALTHFMDINVQVLVCLVIRNVVKRDKTYRRSSTCVDFLRANLNRLKHLDSVVEATVDAFRIMAQASCVAVAADDILVADLGVLTLVVGLAQSYSHKRRPCVVLPAIRFASLVVGLRMRPACEALVLGGGIELSLGTLLRHQNAPPLLTAALRLLVLAARIDGDEATGGPHPLYGVANRVNGAKCDSWTEEVMARQAYESGAPQSPRKDPDAKPLHPVELILKTLMRFHSNAKLQLGGTELLKALISASVDAQAALAGIRGGLDWLCQGPDEGNVLIHWREGHLHNPGWALGDQPYSTHTAQEFLWDGVSALAAGERGSGVALMRDAIAADDIGLVSCDSVHAHVELAALRHTSREYDESEAHFEAALRRVAQDMAEAHAIVQTEQTTIQAAGGVLPNSPHLPAAFRPGDPSYKHQSSGSGSGSCGNASKRSEKDAAASALAAYEATTYTGSTGSEDAGAAASTSKGGGRGRGGAKGVGAKGVGGVDLTAAFQSLHKAEARMAAAVVRRDAIVLSRNLMRADREGGAQNSKPLELWTVETMAPYFPERAPLSASAQAAHDALVGERGGREPPPRPHPTRFPPVAGTTQPATWHEFSQPAKKRYFNMLRRQGLLPVYGEQPPEWRKRIQRWEKETGNPLHVLAMVERDAEFPGLFPV